jgi:N-acetylneuraminate synthase
MSGQLNVAGRAIGPGLPCFFIAEAGVNHNGSLERALELVDIAAAAGADAIKFQTFDADRLATRDAPKAGYQQAATGAEESQHAMLARLQLDAAAHRALMQRCEERGILFLSTPFDERAADLLADLGVAAYKTPSGELTNLPFLAHVARFGRPMIVSTGMATLAEVENAVTAIRTAAPATPVVLLHCVSNYPATAASANLRAMETLARAFGVPVGYSDHTLGIDVALASVALGACVLEKHFTADRTLPGPDHQASLEPDELRALVAGVRNVHAALGDGRKLPAPSEAATGAVARKSLVAARDIAAGETIAEADLTVMRPGTGLAPALREHVAGRAARAAIARGTLIGWEMLA